MHAAVLHSIEKLSYEPTAKVSPPPGEALVDVKATGVCGSDIPRVFSDAAHFYPLVLGHEFSGVVAAVGSPADEAWIGTRVAVAPLVPCHDCNMCSTGRFALCKDYKFIGSSRNGALAEFVNVPVRNLVPLGKKLTFLQGSLVEPSSVALHGLLAGDYRPGLDVAVLGGGTIGNLTAQWAKLYGAQSVTVIDINPQRLRVAHEVGIDHTINSLVDDVPEKVAAITGGAGFGHIFETAGQGVTQQQAFNLAAANAAITLIGTSHRDLNFPAPVFELLNRKEIVLTASWMSYSAPFPGKEWTQSVRYMEEGRLMTPPSLWHETYSLKDVPRGMQILRDGVEVRGKVSFVQE